MARQRESEGSSDSAREREAGEGGATEEAYVEEEGRLVSVRYLAGMMLLDMRGGGVGNGLGLDLGWVGDWGRRLTHWRTLRPDLRPRL